MSKDPSCGGYKDMIVAAITQAIRDLRSENPIDSLDAAMFLTSNDFPFWAEAAGIPDADGYKLLTGGYKWTARTF